MLWLEHVLCVQDKTCKFFLPRIVITHVMNLVNGIWRHHLLANKVGQNSCPLDNIHLNFSVICVRFMYKYLTLCYMFSLFLIWRRLSFLKTFLVFFRYIYQKFHTKYSLNQGCQIEHRNIPFFFLIQRVWQ